MTVEPNDIVWALELQGTLLTPLMARNALKSNVTWASYPFLPPTSASGFFVDLLEGMKWYERNDNHVRRLHELPDYQGVFALGAFPDQGRLSRKHFRAHLGSLGFNYEAYVWKAGQNEGKKLAVVEEFLAERLRFVVIARELDPLQKLHQVVRGKIAPIAKKGCVQMEFTPEPRITRLSRRQASGNERPMTMALVGEIGSFPLGVQPYRVAMRSESSVNGIRWFTYDCMWSMDVCFRAGWPIYADSEGRAIGEWLLKEVGFLS